MRGPSLTHWTWLKRPAAVINNDSILPGKKVEPYTPGSHVPELLNGVLEIKDEKSALEFARTWGLLGLGQAAGDNGNEYDVINAEDNLKDRQGGERG